MTFDDLPFGAYPDPTTAPCYEYALLSPESVVVRVPEEYFFPELGSSLRHIESQPFFVSIRQVMLDFSQCSRLHGAGMGLETQGYYEYARQRNIEVCWVGNWSMYSIILQLAEHNFKPEEIIPYYPSMAAVENKAL